MSWASQAKASSSWADAAEEEEQLKAQGKDAEAIPEYDDTQHTQSQSQHKLPASSDGGGFADVEIKKKELPPNTETFDEAKGLERKQKVEDAYLRLQQVDITDSMRAILLDW